MTIYKDQLTLGIRLRDEANFDSFLVGENQEIVSSLKRLLDSSDYNYIYLHGLSGVGKSHLLQACCQYVAGQQQLSFYLPLSNEYSPSVLENLDHFSLICIDNIDSLQSDSSWEEPLFHFYNRSQQNRARLLIAGRTSPSQLSFGLQDLVSRLTSGITYGVKELSDPQKIAALQLRAQLRGLELAPEVGHYLLNRYPRDMTLLFELLEKLDLACFEAQRRLTIPFIKLILSEK